jgi:hypothetical protein
MFRLACVTKQKRIPTDLGELREREGGRCGGEEFTCMRWRELREREREETMRWWRRLAIIRLTDLGAINSNKPCGGGVSGQIDFH